MSVVGDNIVGGSVAELRAALAVREREVAEARDQQAATAGILRIISSSPGDLAPVFDAILKSATALCDAKLATLFGFDGGRRDGAAARIPRRDRHHHPQARRYARALCR